MGQVKKNPRYSFTQISNHLIVAKDLKGNEFRMLCYILSRPDGWTVRNSNISKELGIKDKNTIANYWKTLTKCGYLKRVRATNEKGSFTGEIDYHISDYCFNPNEEKHQVREKPYLGKTPNNSNTDLSVLGKPNTDIKKEGCQVLPNLTHTDLILWLENNGMVCVTEDDSVYEKYRTKEYPFIFVNLISDRNHEFYQEQIESVVLTILSHNNSVFDESELRTQIKQIKFDNEAKAKLEGLEVEPETNFKSSTNALSLISETIEHSTKSPTVIGFEREIESFNKLEELEIEKTTLAAKNGKGEAIEKIIGRVKQSDSPAIQRLIDKGGLGTANLLDAPESKQPKELTNYEKVSTILAEFAKQSGRRIKIHAKGNRTAVQACLTKYPYTYTEIVGMLQDKRKEWSAGSKMDKFYKIKTLFKIQTPQNVLDEKFLEYMIDYTEREANPKVKADWERSIASEKGTPKRTSQTMDATQIDHENDNW